MVRSERRGIIGGAIVKHVFLSCEFWIGVLFCTRLPRTMNKFCEYYDVCAAQHASSSITSVSSGSMATTEHSHRQTFKKH